MTKYSKSIWLISVTAFLLVVPNCSYVHMCIYRNKLKSQMENEPSQTIIKELESESNCIIYGEIRSIFQLDGILAVAAISYKYGKQDIVASSFLCEKGYYSIVVPPGQYQLLTFLDINKDSSFTSNECIDYYSDKTSKLPYINILPNKEDLFYKRCDIIISSKYPFDIEQPISLHLPPIFSCYPSKTYPANVLRKLSDTLFSHDVAKIGIYNQVQFAHLSGLYMYALSERDFNKIPVIFVHGYGGTPRDFTYIVHSLDTIKYQPFFFYYPSGMGLHKSSRILYEIFFSGNIFHLNLPIVVIAHSMGGLVARAALNLYSTLNKSTFPVEFISLCTPYGGSNEASQSIKSAPVVVDSWQDIATGSAFLQKLNDTKLSKNIRFTLIFGYRNSGIPNIDGCSDGTILLSKQLFLPVQQTADVVLGFEETHTGILTNKDVAGQIGVILNHFHHDE